MRLRVVSLVGGLGNQLFQVAAAFYIERFFNARVLIDTSQLGASNRFVTPRELELDLEMFGFEKQGVPRIFWRVPAKLRSTISQDVPEPWGVPESRPKRPLEILRGYFQSYRLVEDVSDTLLQKVESALDMTQGDYVAVHIRLGDYTHPSTAKFHGLTNPEWSVKMGHQLRSAGHSQKVRLFTDSPELLTKYVSPKLLQGVDIDNSPSSIAVLSEMSRAKALVMANSSLSWWAAYISEKRFGSLPIIFPTPWLAEPSPLDSHLLSQRWIATPREFTA